MELQLRIWPDPVLLKKAAPVTTFDDELRARIARMWEIMYASKGVGLAAPQAGWSAQVLVLNPAGDAAETDEALVIINPQVIKRWRKATDQEGCLSFPEIYVDVTRPAGLRLGWDDEHGEHHEQDFSDFVARIIQHEMDHLTGVLLVHRMSPVDKIRYRHELDELAAAATQA